MDITVRGRTIRCYAKAGNVKFYKALYEALSDEELDVLQQESIDHEQASVKQEGT